MSIRIGIIGSGSWATALAKILTDNGHTINWWVRNEQAKEHILKRHHNPSYLSSVHFQVELLHLCTNVKEVVEKSDLLLIALPSAYIKETLLALTPQDWENKKILSAVKGIIPQENVLLNAFLQEQFQLTLDQYFAVLGPCHAEEVAAEKLSYLTFSGVDKTATQQVAALFKTDYINTIVNTDVWGVQYAAVLKNIYALGAGIAHGLEYGDNFLSVYIANAADEMAAFLKQFGALNIDVGEQVAVAGERSANYAASVYLGDLLVTCYSLHSRNRAFGNLIGKGYSVKASLLEMNMVAEGYNAARCIKEINERIGAVIPIVQHIYSILWENVPARKGFEAIEKVLI